jgi:uncharacterized protein
MQLALREFHAFEAAGASYLYLVPSAAVFRLDETSRAVLDELTGGPRDAGEVVAALTGRLGAEAVRQAIAELVGAQAVGKLNGRPAPAPPPAPVPKRIPLQTLVLNVTSKCNLACKYCYEYGEDRVVESIETATPRFMTEATARQSVDFAFTEAGDNRVVHVTFFGGETLLNFKVLQSTVAYARTRAAELGKIADFSLTTNATLLRPEIIEWLIANQVGVTVSIDGPKEAQDRFRVFHNGAGSYEMIVPKIRELLQRHTARPIGARVTLTRQNLDVRGIFRHLTEEIGFREVGFAPVTTSQARDWAIEGEHYGTMLDQFEDLAGDFLAAALADRPHGFSNARDTLEEIHKGMSKAYPCGAGFGLLGVATDGDVSLCHRFAGSPGHEMGSVFTGVNRERQEQFLQDHHLDHKTDCRTCWARPICAGGCYHEAHTRYGDTREPNLHYCTWIRRWTDTCLRMYGELAERNPAFLARFNH